MTRGRDPAKEVFWRQQIGDQASSGKGIRAFCRERKLAENSFYFWRSQIADRDETAQTETSKPSTFVSVNVKPSATQPIELVHPSGSLVRLSPGVDWHDVARLFELLDARREVRQ